MEGRYRSNSQQLSTDYLNYVLKQKNKALLQKYLRRDSIRKKKHDTIHEMNEKLNFLKTHNIIPVSSSEMKLKGGTHSSMFIMIIPYSLSMHSENHYTFVNLHTIIIIFCC